MTKEQKKVKKGKESYFNSNKLDILRKKYKKNLDPRTRDFIAEKTSEFLENGGEIKLWQGKRRE